MTDAAYTAYSYLTAGEDFRRFELAPEFGRVPPYAGGLTDGEAGRAAALLRDSLVISLHDHPVRFPARMEETPEYNRTGRQHAAYAGLAASGLTVVFDNMMDGTACVTGNAPWRWDDIITDLGMRQADLAHAPGVMTVRTVADIDEAYRSGRTGLVFGLEAATPIENELDRLDILYGLGIRQIGIAYSDANTLGSGLNEPVDGGLTSFGKRAVRRMNQLGLAIDLSHSSDRTALDTSAATSAPLLITHAGARAVWDSPRMKPDDVLRAVADTGGVIGMSEGAARGAAQIAAVEQQLRDIDTAQLDDAGQTDAAVLTHLAAAARSDLEQGLWEANASAGGYVSPAAKLLQSVPSALLRDPAAVHGYLERLRGLPAFLDAVAARSPPRAGTRPRPASARPSTSSPGTWTGTWTTTRWSPWRSPAPPCLQIASAQTLPLPAYRRFLDAEVCGYVEGWGLYSERLADEMGLYTSDLQRLGMLSFDALRACRLVVDTGMHYYGWSRARAADFMWNHTATTRANVENEISRYIGWPGQALAYMTGRREIQRLRGLAERALGARFDVRAFHGTVLGQGAVPLGVLEQLVTRWADYESRRLRS